MRKKYLAHLPFFIAMSFTGVLLMLRVFYSGSVTYLFLVWNLFLAWVPLLISSCLSKLSQSKYLQGVLLISWLIFFPNSLYIITDLVHLKERENVPLWFDCILLVSAILNGMMMAYASLNRIENYLLLKFPYCNCNIILFGCFFLSSLGIYIGRFLRLNSWDIFTNPFDLSVQVVGRFIFPLHHPTTWAITIILTLFFNVFYFTIKTMPGFTIETRK
jgi:uncharacterized membrane protein